MLYVLSMIRNLSMKMKICVEPMSADNPLREIKDSNKLIITPHIAWASVEARTRLMNIILGQVKEYFK